MKYSLSYDRFNFHPRFDWSANLHPFTLTGLHFHLMTLLPPLSCYLSPTYPSFPIERRWLISEPLSPAAICCSRTETHYLALCGRLEMELFIRQSRALSALCRLHYSLCYVWETISVSCFLRCYLLVVPLEMVPGLWRFIILSEGLLDKRTQHPPLCLGDMAARDEENVRASRCNDLPVLPPPLS